MSAEMLQRAADLIRARATEPPVPTGPWESEFSDVIRTDIPLYDPGYLIAECSTIAEARHIASWGPSIALAVAEWLEEVAGWREEGLGLMPSTNLADAWGEIERCANKVACVYLGEQ